VTIVLSPMESLLRLTRFTATASAIGDLSDSAGAGTGGLVGVSVVERTPFSYFQPSCCLKASLAFTRSREP